MSIDVDIRIDPPTKHDVDVATLTRGIRVAAESHGYETGWIELWITTDPSIHRVNREHLDHDYPTDVISFGYLADAGRLEGEMVVSRETADRQAARLGVDPAEELLRYVIHGTLHIAGMDDADAMERSQMRTAEDRVIREVRRTRPSDIGDRDMGDRDMGDRTPSFAPESAS